MAQFLWYDCTFKKQCTVPVTLTFWPTLLAKKLWQQILGQNLDLIHSHFTTDRIMYLKILQGNKWYVGHHCWNFGKISESYHGFYRSYVQQQLICTQI